ncbi:uncharacterized protein LOC141575509 [Camelus bactrianus]|uniref:Uncharacterized protein LOC141575509 n=1 Tax=Camelus bactrianus TaxID=9837 RepID=A0AC58PLT4_CAMBA
MAKFLPSTEKGVTVHKTHFPRTSISDTKGSTGLDLQTRPRRRLNLQLIALHRHPHFLSSRFPFSQSSFLTQPCGPARGHAHPTLGLGERGPGAARRAGGPRESGVVPATPGAPRPPPASPTSRPGRGTRTPTPNSPPGRKQEGGSRGFPDPPTGRPSPGSGLRKSGGQFPAAPLLCSTGLLRGRGEGWVAAAFWGAAGEAARGERRRPAALWLGARVLRLLPGWPPGRGAGGLRPPGAGPEALRAPTFVPEVSRGTAPPLQEPGRWWRAPVGEVRDPRKLRPKSGSEKGVGPHKPPRVKGDEVAMRRHLADSHCKEHN